MCDIEKKLASYRAQKESHYHKFKNVSSLFSPNNNECKETLRPSENEYVLQNVNSNLSDISSISESDSNTSISSSYLDWIYYILCFGLWATVYLIFIKLQFGTIYLITSVLIGIFCNTRTGPKKEGEISAYSVFNKNCESIDGTLKAEQFEKEIRYGSAVVRQQF